MIVLSLIHYLPFSPLLGMVSSTQRSRSGIFDADNPAFAEALSTLLIILGVAGFFSDGTLFVFSADFHNNVFRILSGLAALSTLRSHHLSQCYLMVLGAMFAIVALAGFLWDGNILGLLVTNRADDYLHAIIAIIALVISFSGRIPLVMKKR